MGYLNKGGGDGGCGRTVKVKKMVCPCFFFFLSFLNLDQRESEITERCSLGLS